MDAREEDEIETLREEIEHVCVAVLTQVGRALTEAEAEAAQRAVEASEDLLALSDWVADSVVAGEFCLHPECFRPPRPSGGRGAPPKYCDLEHPTIPGRYAHDRHSSRARRKTLLDRRSTRRATEAAVRSAIEAASPAPPRSPTAEQRPATTALDQVPAAVSDVQRQLKLLSSTVDRLVQDIATGADPVARRTEIEQINRSAAELVRVAEERAAHAERAAADAARGEQATRVHVDEAHEVADRALADAEQARAAFVGSVRITALLLAYAQDQVQQALRLRDESIAAADHAEQVAQWLAAEARWTAQQEVARARRELDEELALHTGEMDARIATAEAERTDAVAEAVRAGQAVTDAHDERNRLADDLKTVRAQREQDAERHREELRAQQAEFDRRLADQVEQTRTTLEATYRAVITGLESTNHQLAARAERAERQADAASAATSPPGTATS